MSNCQRAIVDCTCSCGYRETDCPEVLCDEPAIMKYRGKWYCLEHGEEVQDIWENNDKR